MLVQKDRNWGSRGLAFKTHTLGGHKGWMWVVCLTLVDQKHRALFSKKVSKISLWFLKGPPMQKEGACPAGGGRASHTQRQPSLS